MQHLRRALLTLGLGLAAGSPAAFAQTTASSPTHPDRELEHVPLVSAERLAPLSTLRASGLIVGAPEASDVVLAGGAASIYARQPDGSWLEEVRFTPSPLSSSFTRLGSCVAIDGDLAAAGAPTIQSEVEVYERSTTTGLWSIVDTLLPPTTGLTDFGKSVAMDGDRIVTAASSSGFIGLGPGRFYIFERQPGGSFAVVGSTGGNKGAFQTGFGDGLDIVGDRAVVGSSQDSIQGLANAGAVFVVERQANGDWLTTATVREPQPQTDAYFGTSVALDGERLIVGAWGGASAGTNAGEVHVFLRQPDGSWAHETELTAGDAQPGDSFGETLDARDGRLIVGSPGADSAGGAAIGANYLFERRADGTWFESARIEIEDPVASDGFGSGVSRSVALTETAALMGARNRNQSRGSVLELDLTTLLHGDTQISGSGGGRQPGAVRARRARPRG